MRESIVRPSETQRLTHARDQVRDTRRIFHPKPDRVGPGIAFSISGRECSHALGIEGQQFHIQRLVIDEGVRRAGDRSALSEHEPDLAVRIHLEKAKTVRDPEAGVASRKGGAAGAVAGNSNVRGWRRSFQRVNCERAFRRCGFPC